MQKADIRILIIEDDPTLGKALEIGLKRSGYGVLVVQNHVQAEAAIRINDYHGLLVDCMLPQKNGIDTTLKLKDLLPEKTVVVLMSGIFKDRAYAVEAQLKTKAVTFLYKPFDLQKLIAIFDQSFNSILDQIDEPLYQLLSKQEYSPREKIVAINNTEFVHGFDLPLVYSQLMDPKISGDLHIEFDDQSISTISFNQGRVEQVIHADHESYFGVLLVEKGFITTEELEENLKKIDKNKIGERLVINSSISPHAAEIVHLEQMIIRMSKSIQDVSVKIRFVEQHKAEAKVAIDFYTFSKLLSDWICSKIPLDWLKSYYNKWHDNPLIQGAEFNKIQLVKNFPAGRFYARLIEADGWPYTLSAWLENNTENEKEILFGVHFLLLQRILAFAPKSDSSDDLNSKTSRFEKILADFKSKNYFEILGVSKNSRAKEVHRAYHELAKSLHPDKLNPNSPPQLKELAQSIFTLVTESYHTISNETKKEAYLKSLEVGLTEEILKAEGSFEEGLRQLKSGQYREARKTFERTLKLRGHRSDTTVYMLWALIKEKRTKTDLESLIQKVENHLSEVPHEDRHSATYFFVKGMYCELTGQIEKAYRNFKHAVKLDPLLSDALRELTLIKQKYGGKKTSLLNQDLSTVMTSIFKKKSG